MRDRTDAVFTLAIVAWGAFGLLAAASAVVSSGLARALFVAWLGGAAIVLFGVLVVMLGRDVREAWRTLRDRKAEEDRG